MSVKEFGIYTKDNELIIITEINNEKIKGVRFPINYFTTLSNNQINREIWNFLDFEIGSIVGIDLAKSPDVFNDFGYLGQIQSAGIQDSIKVRVRELLDADLWDFMSN